MSTHQGGYTMVEIMIFLVISGAMLTWAVASIRARQHQVEFSQTVRDFEQRLKDVMNDIATGYYPNATGFDCRVQPPGNVNAEPEFSVAGGPSEPGTNKDCIFIGKAVQLSVHNTDQAGYNIYTVLGRRQTIDPTSGAMREVLSFEEANPVPLVRSGGGGFDYTDKRKLEWGVKIKDATSGLIGYFTTFAGVSNPSQGLDSGSSSTQTIAIPGPLGGNFPLNADQNTAVTAIEDMLTPPAGSSSDLAICLERSDGEEWAMLSIPANGRMADMKTQFRGSADAPIIFGGITC